MFYVYSTHDERRWGKRPADAAMHGETCPGDVHSILDESRLSTFAALEQAVYRPTLCGVCSNLSLKYVQEILFQSRSVLLAV